MHPLILLLAALWNPGDRVCVWNNHYRSGCDYERITQVDNDHIMLTGLKLGFHLPLVLVDESVPQDQCPPAWRDLTVWHEQILKYNGCRIMREQVSHDQVGQSKLELPKTQVYDRVGSDARNADPVGEFGKKVEKPGDNRTD